MRPITVKYATKCQKCQKKLPKGATAVYERRVGLFCPDCAPTDPEEIRAYRQKAADRKAERLEGWAEKRRDKAKALVVQNEPYHGDTAFHTQPGRIIERERFHRRTERMWDHSSKAQKMEEQARRLRCGVQVKGDAERRRQKAREERDRQISKGSRVSDFCFGLGTVVGVYKKSYRIKFDKGSTHSRDKSYVKLA